jgi:hypothetical protein
MPRIQAIFNTQPSMVLGQTIVKYLGIRDSLYDHTAKLTEMINQLADLLIQTPQYEAFAMSMEASTRRVIQPSYMFNPKTVTPQPRTMTPPPPLETPVPTPSPSQSIYRVATPYPGQKSVTPSPSPNSPSPVPSPPPLRIHVEQPMPFITRDKMVLAKIIERKITKTPPRPQTKLVITKAPKKKLLTIFATPLSHAGKQVVATLSPGSSKDSPIDLMEDNEQNPFSSDYDKLCTQCGKQGHEFEWCHHFMCPKCYRTAPGHLVLRCPITIKEKKDNRRYMRAQMFGKTQHMYLGNFDEQEDFEDYVFDDAAEANMSREPYGN